MTTLKPDMKLQRIPELELRLDSSNYVHIHFEGGEFRCPPRSLTILDLFSQPTSVAEANETLRTRSSGLQDWIDLTSVIIQFYENGVLEDVQAGQLRLRVEPDGFDAARIHVAMLNDKPRTAQYLAAIREIVRPGDVVADIGTGTGVLAVAAAQAGARHVYALEAKEAALFRLQGVGADYTSIHLLGTRACPRQHSIHPSPEDGQGMCLAVAGMDFTQGHDLGSRRVIPLDLHASRSRQEGWSQSDASIDGVVQNPRASGPPGKPIIL